MRAGPILAALCAGALAGLPAQEVLEVDAPEPATIRLGDAARVAIRIEGRSANPRAPQLPQVDGLRLSLSPPSRSTYTMFDGRTTVERIGVAYTLELKPLRTGTFVVPPFPIWTGTREQRTPELRLDVREDLAGGDFGWLEVEVEPRRVYVHETVRVRVRCGVLQGARLVQDFYNRYRYLDLEVQAPWLDALPGGERVAVPEPRGETRLMIVNRQLVQAAFEGAHERGGQRWQTFTFERAYLPTRLGRIELPMPTLRMHLLRREGQQDVFGRAVGALTDNYFVYGQPQAIEVMPIPEAGRPTPFYGAVGRFTIEAALDRDSVRLGESVKLTLTVRGQGNLEFLRMPGVDALPGFHKLGEAEAQRDADRVVVTYDLTPLSADVHAVPPIGWNYFDTTPGVERFVEVSTPALALVVMPLAAGESLAPLPGAAPRAVIPGVDDIHDLPDLDGPPVVVHRPPPLLGLLVASGPWVGAALLLLGVRLHRRARGDERGRRARAALRSCEAALRRGDEPLAALVGYLADRLGVPPAAIIAADLEARLVAGGLPAAAARAAAALVERGTAARYGGGAALAAADVLAAVRQIEGARPAARMLLLAALLPIGAGCPPDDLAPAPAQGELAAAIESYRQGDLAAADAAFARLYAATGDRRHLRARGNCLYRLGDLPRALWAYEAARLGLPRDQELLQNIRLLRARLELEQPAMGFAAAAGELLRWLTPNEQLLALATAMTVAAACLLFGRRRAGLRWLGALLLVPGAALAAEVVWLAPARPPAAIALERLELTAEPRGDLPPVATVRPGVVVAVRGSEVGNFVRVEVDGLRGYAPRRAVLRIE